MSFDFSTLDSRQESKLSQSLSSRAMSFDDIHCIDIQINKICLNPFRAGRCLSTERRGDKTVLCSRLNPFRAGRCLSTDDVLNMRTHFRVSIPFEQGDVFRPRNGDSSESIGLCLNPFRAGRCLSTKKERQLQMLENVSIPFEQGDVFRQKLYFLDNENFYTSQSLSSRAMSFDCSGMLEAGIMRPFRPTSQFFWKVKELALDLSK